MATLEKPRKRISRRRQIRESDHQIENERDASSSYNDAVIDDLLNEAFDDVDYTFDEGISRAWEAEHLAYNQTAQSIPVSSTQSAQSDRPVESNLTYTKYMSREAIDSVFSLRHYCLLALDSLLQQIALESETESSSIARPPPAHLSGSYNSTRTRSLSSPLEYLHSPTPLSTSAHSGTSLLASIERSARRISTPIELIPREPSSPLHQSFIDLHHSLGARRNVSDDYDLACTLAALLGYLYQFLEDVPEATSKSDEYPPEAHVFAAIRQEVSALRTHPHSQLSMDDEHAAIWNEIQKLMEVVSRLCHERDQPPPYHLEEFATPKVMLANSEREKQPPAYSATDEKCQRDLENVMSAIERMQCVAPPMNDQRVELNERQIRELSVAAVSKIVERLSRGRLEEQRAIQPPTKLETLNRLLEVVEKAVERRLDDQRATLSPRLSRRMEEAKLHAVLDRIDRGRMTNQDYELPEQLLVADMHRLTTQLLKLDSEDAKKYGQQRYELSKGKERDMFVAQVMGKVERLPRMRDQDAEPPQKLPLYRTAAGDFEKMIKQLERSHSTSLSDQRATLRTKGDNF
ncbi:uncharacterized protein VTP21DRAFT_3340 [Calcarisporiella thermophila]|uniref:uncharacterized protein n=1 Tax=Calcarisporiella thermophila TaxID=911321 RepID=UPI00374381DE